jgi:hypothetical protein
VGKFQDNLLLENVNLYVHYADYFSDSLDEQTLLRGLIHILPLISSIDSIQINSSEIDLFQMVYNKNNINDGQSHESQLLLKEMMTKTRIVLTNWLNDRFLFLSFFLN